MLGSVVESTYIRIDAYKRERQNDQRAKAREARSLNLVRGSHRGPPLSKREGERGREREISSREQQPRNLLVGEDRVKTGVAGVSGRQCLSSHPGRATGDIIPESCTGCSHGIAPFTNMCLTFLIVGLK